MWYCSSFETESNGIVDIPEAQVVSCYIFTIYLLKGLYFCCLLSLNYGNIVNIVILTEKS